MASGVGVKQSSLQDHSLTDKPVVTGSRFADQLDSFDSRNFHVKGEVLGVSVNTYRLDEHEDRHCHLRISLRVFTEIRGAELLFDSKFSFEIDNRRFIGQPPLVLCTYRSTE